MNKLNNSMHPQANQGKSRQGEQILADADLCVMCGMCLPHCPTYQLYQSEAESPRGRIALMQSIESARIEASASALKHIDHCLGCQNCETICPSRVPFGRMMDGFRDKHHRAIAKPLASRRLLKSMTRPASLDRLSQLANLPLLRQALKISQPLHHLPLPAPASEAPLQSFYPRHARHDKASQNHEMDREMNSEEASGQVTLFTGCAETAVSSQMVLDAVELLNRLGFDVHLPSPQGCCGALHQHNGAQQTAAGLLKDTTEGLQRASRGDILFFSPACAQQLSQSAAIEARDIRQFILQQLQQRPIAFAPLTRPVALHESCSHRNRHPQRGQLTQNLNRELLKRVPQLQIVESRQPSLCCGAGGLQGLNYPQQAGRLRRQKLDSFDLSQCQLLISDNSGCSLHLRQILCRENPDIEVIHPVSLLARQLAAATDPLPQSTDTSGHLQTSPGFNRKV